MKRQRPLPARKKESEGGSSALARLLAVAEDLLSQLETAVKRQDASAITALVGSTGSITPALNAVARIIKTFKEEAKNPTYTEKELAEMDDLASAWLLRQCHISFGFVPDVAFERIGAAVMKEINALISEGVVKPRAEEKDDE